MVELYKDGDDMVIVTDAQTEGGFLNEFAELLAAMIENGTFDSDWEFQLRFWLPSVVDICCKYRGYKTDVLEKRVLCAGGSGFSGFPPLVSRIREGKVIVEWLPMELEG